MAVAILDSWSTHQVPTITILFSNSVRQSSGVDLPFRPQPNDSEGSRNPGVHRPRSQSEIPHMLVLKPGLVIYSIYNGYWFWGRPSVIDLWHDLRTVTREIRPDWDLSAPGLREAWDAGDYASFHGWDRRSAQSMPTSYS